MKHEHIYVHEHEHAHHHDHAHHHTHHHTHDHGYAHDEKGESVLEVRHLSISFSEYDGKFGKKDVDVISDLNVSIKSGEIVAVVGSSGSGKSLLAHAILGILPYNASFHGEIKYNGESLTDEKIKKLRGNEIVLVPQSVNYLDPLMKTGKQLCRGKKDASLVDKVKRTFARYGLDENTIELYPFELSGGMTRRVLISSAVMESPKLVIADEPTPGLHASAARRVLSHFREIADDGAGVLLITHDLELALECADRVVVFYAGQTIEEARPADFGSEDTLRHPYTKALYRALPQNGFKPIAGSQPYAEEMPDGCTFAPRCEFVCDECRKGKIDYYPLDGGYVRCIRAKSADAEE